MKSRRTHKIRARKCRGLFRLFSKEEANNIGTSCECFAAGPSEPGTFESDGGTEQNPVRPGDVARILDNLKREDVPTRNMDTILETLYAKCAVICDPDILTECVRQALCCDISMHFAPRGQAHVVTLDPSLEVLIAENTRLTEHGTRIELTENEVRQICSEVKQIIDSLDEQGITPIVLTPPHVRSQFRRITENAIPDLIVLSYNELDRNVEVLPNGKIGRWARSAPRGESVQ